MNIKTHVALMYIVLACTTAENKSIEEIAQPRAKLLRAEWLIGSWYNKSSQGVSFEVWEKRSDSVFAGKSFSIVRADTVIAEYITLVQQGDEVRYIPTVPDQNKGLPVSFQLISLDSSSLVFENQAHDFPQSITYRLISKDSLVAEISGIIKGEHRTRQFPMRRSQ